jgi:hypothetical protein
MGCGLDHQPPFSAVVKERVAVSTARFEHQDVLYIEMYLLWKQERECRFNSEKGEYV